MTTNSGAIELLEKSILRVAPPVPVLGVVGVNIDRCISPNIELKQIHTLTEMDACTYTVQLYMYAHVHVYQNNVDERID